VLFSFLNPSLRLFDCFVAYWLLYFDASVTWLEQEINVAFLVRENTEDQLVQLFLRRLVSRFDWASNNAR